MNRIHGSIAALSLSLAAASFGQNLLWNPGFEDEGDGWTLWHQGGTVAEGTVTYPNTGAYEGTRYARIEVTTPSETSGENWHIQFQPPAWEAQAGVEYEFKFWGKSELGSIIHVSVQGPDYTYLTGSSFSLSTEWSEHSVYHYAEEGGTGAVRFHVYVAEVADVYSFDSFSVTAQTVNVKAGAGKQAQGLRVRQEPAGFVVSLGANAPESWKAELVDLRGKTIASANGKADASLSLAHPEKSGVYFVRASAGTRSWVRKVTVQ